MSAATQLNINLPSPLQALPASLLNSDTTQIWVKRDDLIHPIISGNKWRKLQAVFHQNAFIPKRGIVSFGGGYSNHLHALGYVCHQLNIPLIAMVRGNYEHNLTPMLQDLKHWEANICWLTRKEYQQKHDSDWLKTKLSELDDYRVIPEGGSGVQVHEGMAQLVAELPADLDTLICPVASGGSLAGIIQALWQQQRKTKVLGIAVLKGEGYLEDLVTSLITHQDALEHDWQILHDYHFGGYAKSSTELDCFCQQFSNDSGIAIEPVYSGKVFYALKRLLQQRFFSPQDKIGILHTGGLQGARK